MQCIEGFGVTVITLLGLARASETLADLQGFKVTGNTERVKRPNTISEKLRLTSWRGALRISSKAKYRSELSREVRLSRFLTLFTAAPALPLADWCPGNEVLWTMRHDCRNSVKAVGLHTNWCALSECRHECHNEQNAASSKVSPVLQRCSWANQLL